MFGGLGACSESKSSGGDSGSEAGTPGDGGTSSGGSGTGGGGKGGTAGASTGGGSGAPFGECGSVVGCSGELCVDPTSDECTGAGCLLDERNAGFELYCTRTCTSDGDCPEGFVCLTANVAGDGTERVCARYLPACANGIVDPREACDDGNTESGDGCSADCSSDESCGNDVLDEGETCDDGNTEGGDGCSADCASDESCGNGVLDEGEDCDDDNLTGEDGCEPDCTITGCGNGHPTEPEACDEMTTACDAECRIVPVDGVSMLTRYPDEQPSSTQTLVAAGPGERLFASWADGPMIPGARVGVMSLDAGEHFQTRRSIGLGAPIGEELVRGTTGNTLAIWAPNYGELRLRRSADFGASWGELQTIEIPDRIQTLYPYFDMVAAGSHWYFAWAEYTGTYGIWLMHSSDAGATWSDPVQVDDGLVMQNSCSDVDLAATSTGHVLAMTCFGPRVSSNFGAAFHDPTTNSMYPNRSTYIGARNAIDLGGGAWIAPSGTSVVRSEDDFETWTFTELLPTYYGSGIIGRSPDGTLYWQWGDRLVSQGDLSIRVSHSDNDGVDWTDPIIVATFPGNMGAATVRSGLFAATSGPYVWWVGPENESADPYVGYLRLARSRDGGQTFDPAVSLTPGAGIRPVPNNPVFVTDSNGATHIFWGQSTTQTAYGYYVQHRLLPVP